MNFEFLFGQDYLKAELPDDQPVEVLSTREVPSLSDPEDAVRQAVESPIASPPLKELARGKDRVCIIVCDHTRPAPTPVMLRPILLALQAGGISPEKIDILVATGLHRGSSLEEIAAFLGEDIASSYNIHNHDARDGSGQDTLPQGSCPAPVYVDKVLTRADLKIATGLIEPHLTAGYSGGCKLVAPGVAGLETIRHLHGPSMMDDPRLGAGNTEGNPFLALTRQVATSAGLDFIVNVTLNKQRKITGVFAGKPVPAHEEGIRFKDASGRAVLKEPVDIAITCGGGAPLDKTLYQSVKGVCGAAPIVRPGGAILTASSCVEGVGSESYRRMLDEADSIDSFLERIYEPGFFEIDQWGIQQYFRVMQSKDIYFHTPEIPEETLSRYHFHPAGDFQAALTMLLEKYGPAPRVAVIPEGPYVVCSFESPA